MSLLEFRRAAVEGEERTLLRAVDVSVEAGERVVVFGGPSSGKHLFLRLAAGAREPDEGRVLLKDPVPGRAAPVGYVTNEGGLLNNMTLLENAVLPGVYHGQRRLSEAADKARALFQELGVGAHADHRPAQASAAARRLAQFVRAFMVEPALFVLDDPLDDVDAATVRTIRRLLQDIGSRKESAAIVGTGRPGRYLEWGSRFILLTAGEAKLFSGREDLGGDPEARVFLQ